MQDGGAQGAASRLELSAVGTNGVRRWWRPTPLQTAARDASAKQESLGLSIDWEEGQGSLSTKAKLYANQKGDRQAVVDL